jgi:tRNA-binding EMAP/Myf-like protein
VCKDCYPRTGGKPTPEQRAEGRRRRGETSVDYVPKFVRSTAAAEKATYRASIKYDAHIKVRNAWMRSEERRLHDEAQHDAHVRAFKHSAVQFRVRYNEDPEFAVKQRLRTQLRKKAKLHPKLDDLIRSAIRTGGSSGKVEVVCGYAVADLVKHLERQFIGGMCWQAFMNGEIHIDHIIPQAAFDLSDLDETRKCWAMSNLQPLWAADNIRKGARHQGQAS